jgi:hypothetical protein
MTNALKTASILAILCCALLNVYARYRPLPDLCELQVSLNCKSNGRRMRGASLPHAETNELEEGDSMTLVPLVGASADSHKHHGSIARGIYGRSRHVSSVLDYSIVEILRS